MSVYDLPGVGQPGPPRRVPSPAHLTLPSPPGLSLDSEYGLPSAVNLRGLANGAPMESAVKHRLANGVAPEICNAVADQQQGWSDVLQELRLQFAQHEKRVDSKLAAHLKELQSLIGAANHSSQVRPVGPCAQMRGGRKHSNANKDPNPTTSSKEGANESKGHEGEPGEKQTKAATEAIDNFRKEETGRKAVRNGNSFENVGFSAWGERRSVERKPQTRYSRQLEKMHEQIKGGKLQNNKAGLDLAVMMDERDHLTVKDVLRSKPVEYSVACLIVMSAGVTGYQVDWSIKRVENKTVYTPLIFQIFETSFSVAFLIELLLRLVADRLFFFSWKNSQLGWNIFDTLLVATSVVDLLILLLETVYKATDESPNLAFIRLLRILRLVRVVRVIRVLRFFRDLRVMVQGIMCSMKSLFWALLLLFLMLYLVSICIIQIGHDKLKQHAVADIALGPNEEEFLKYCGSLTTALYTLYISILGGVDWNDVAEPLGEVDGRLKYLFILYIAFGMLCVLNIITGVFVENASSYTRNDEDMARMTALANKQAWYKKVKNLFQAADEEDTGMITDTEFSRTCDDPEAIACLEGLGIDVTVVQPREIFKLFDFDQDGVIDLEDFADGLQRVHGHARSLDICRVYVAVQDIVKKLGAFERRWSHLNSERMECMAASCSTRGFHRHWTELLELTAASPGLGSDSECMRGSPLSSTGTVFMGQDDSSTGSPEESPRQVSDDVTHFTTDGLNKVLS